jgi:hypothetical protein
MVRYRTMNRRDTPLGFCKFNVLYTMKRKAASSNNQSS